MPGLRILIIYFPFFSIRHHLLFILIGFCFCLRTLLNWDYPPVIEKPSVFILIKSFLKWQLFHTWYLCKWIFSMCCQACSRFMCWPCFSNLLWMRQKWFCSGKNSHLIMHSPYKKEKPPWYFLCKWWVRFVLLATMLVWNRPWASVSTTMQQLLHQQLRRLVQRRC